MEPQLSNELYLLFRDLLVNRCGLFYPEHKREDLSHGLNLAMKKTGHRNFAELYTDTLQGGPVWETVLEHLTIGETSFFRNKPQFEAFQQHIFPELFQRRASLRSIRIWSAGCATGEEPYSIAMLLKEILPDISQWNITILATDINPTFLFRAREGLYGNWSFRDTPEDLKVRFFTQKQNRWLLNADIRNMVTFTRINLVEPIYPSITNGTTALDMILCRNVTIYFDEPTTRQIIDRFYRALAPGGWLIVGHSEPQASIYAQFEVYNFPNTVIYRKRIDAPFFSQENSSLSSFFTAPFLSPAEPPVSAATLSGVPTSEGSVRKDAQAFSPPAVAPSWTQKVVSPTPPKPDSFALVSLQKNTKPRPAPSLPIPTPYAKAQHSDLDIENLWKKVKSLLQRAEKQAAEELINKILLVQPDHGEALIALGKLHADRGEWACAQYHCELALKKDPLQIDAHYILGQIHEHQGNLESALNEYRKVVYLDRQFVLGLLGMANVWKQMGRMEDARRSYRNVLKQLYAMSPTTVIPGTDGATANELTVFVTRQIQMLK